MLLDEPTVSGAFDRAELDELIDPAAYLGLSAEIAGELAACATTTADRLDALPERAPLMTR